MSVHSLDPRLPSRLNEYLQIIIALLSVLLPLLIAVFVDFSSNDLFTQNSSSDFSNKRKAQSFGIDDLHAKRRTGSRRRRCRLYGWQSARRPYARRKTYKPPSRANTPIAATTTNTPSTDLAACRMSIICTPVLDPPTHATHPTPHTSSKTDDHQFELLAMIEEVSGVV